MGDLDFFGDSPNRSPEQILTHLHFHAWQFHYSVMIRGTEER
jgi:hypothetical protein